MSFQDLMRNKTNALQKLQAKVQESKGGGGKKDPRMWKIPYDAQCNGTALIRFLPWGDGERLAYAEWTEFSFKGKGGNYWERCLHDIGQDDPVASLNSDHWNFAKENGEVGTDGKFKGPESDAVKKRGKRSYYVANVFILEDNMNPQNVGQNKLFKFGNQIKQKIDAKLVPEYEDQQAVNVFDFFNGANFRVRAKGKKWGGQMIPNYEDSVFMEPTPLHEDMEVLKGIYEKMHDLSEFEAETNYKSAEELEKQMTKVLGQAEISRIRGEAFDPAAAASAGANPFENAGQSAAARAGQQQQQQAADPFANAQQAAGADPFAQAAQTGGADPFAKAAQAEPKPEASSADPFAQTSTGNADPFAQAGQQAADPFAQAAAEPKSEPAASADPFAQAGGADPFAASGGGNADPFANIDV